MEPLNEKLKKRIFYRRAIKVGNSSGVLLPKSLFGSELKITLIKPPRNIKRDLTLILSNMLEEIMGIYIINQNEKKIEILVPSSNINRHLEKGVYIIDIVPLNHLKKSIKEKKDIREKILKARAILNKILLEELKRI